MLACVSWDSHPGTLVRCAHWLRRLTEAVLRFNARPAAAQKYHYCRIRSLPIGSNPTSVALDSRYLIRGHRVQATRLTFSVNVPVSLLFSCQCSAKRFSSAE